MDRKEKNARKAKLNEKIDLGNGRYKDEEIEKLELIADNSKNYDGLSQTYRNSYKTFDSEDTYRVDEVNTYSFHDDENGIRIEHEFERHWDDGQNDTYHETYSTGRDILNNFPKIIKK